MPITPSVTTPIRELATSLYPGRRLYLRRLEWGMAARILATRGQEAAATYLKDHIRDVQPYDAQPPACYRIVAMSRPLTEWPIYRATQAVQRWYYAQTAETIRALHPAPFTAERRQRWILRSGVDLCGYSHAMGLNKILSASREIYFGVEKAVDTRNTKARVRHERANRARRERGEEETVFVPEQTYGVDGRFVHPPSPNPTIWLCQTHPVTVYDGSVPGYRSIEGGKPIPRGQSASDRLAIPPGQPGYIPAHQRDLVRITGRQRQTRSTKPTVSHSLLLIQVRIGDDWLLADARGLLRMAWRHKLIRKQTTLNELLGMFTDSPIIHVGRSTMQFRFRPGIIPIIKRKPITHKWAPELIESRLREGSVALASIDLGQTNPVAMRVSRLTATGAEHMGSRFLPDRSDDGPSLALINLHRQRHDALEAALRCQAEASLPEEYRLEIEARRRTPAQLRTDTCRRLRIDEDAVPWDAMTRWSTHIADHLMSLGRAAEAFFTTRQKKRLKIYDYRYARLSRRVLSDNAHKALQDALHTIKRESLEYRRLSTRQRELARWVANWCVQETQQMSGIDQVILNIEDLNVTNKLFSGCGKRGVGWDSFFDTARENRFWIRPLHKALSELAPHRGLDVVESAPQYTSQACPGCRLIDARSRDGESFSCVGCSSQYHADLEVATFNLEQVCRSGRALRRQDTARGPAPHESSGPLAH